VLPIFGVLVARSNGGHTLWGAAVFGAAGITDQIDGYLARRWNVESAFGKIADPLADRLLIALAVVLLWHAGRLPWLGLAIPLRDVVLVGLTPLALKRGYRFEVNLAGKGATWVLYASLAAVLCTGVGTAWPLWIFWFGVVLAVVALAQYVQKARREVRS
jgi:CDP-diacylglycerol--glycerol-3-phosphate 3-phosphatidyltransferase